MRLYYAIILFLFAHVSASYVGNITTHESMASTRCKTGLRGTFTSDQLLGYYLESTLVNLKYGLSAEAATRGDGRLLEIVKIVDELRGLDWCQQNQQHKAARLINGLSSTLQEEWKHLDTTWPVARRLVMGTLLQGLQQTSDGPVYADLRRAADYAVKAMFQINIRGMAYKSAIHFMHVSKSAGSTMCILAKKNQCTSVDFTMRANCRIKAFHDNPAWTSTSHFMGKNGKSKPALCYRSSDAAALQELSCGRRHQTLVDNGWNFFANELYLPCHKQGHIPSTSTSTLDFSKMLAKGVHECDPEHRPDINLAATTVTVYRSIIQQAARESILQDGNSRKSCRGTKSGDESGREGARAFDMLPGEQTANRNCLCNQFINIINVRDPIARAVSNLKHAALGNGIQWQNTTYLIETHPRIVDNYYIRSLIGSAAFWLPLGAINASHVRQALLTLQQFDLVLVPDDAHGSDLALKHGLGWQTGLHTTHSNALRSLLKLEVLKPLLKVMNPHDIRLHRHACVLHGIDVALLARGAELVGTNTTDQQPCGFVKTAIHDF